MLAIFRRLFCVMLTHDSLPLRISDRAVTEVQAILAKKQIPDGYGLRVGVRGGGCGAVGYVLGFDKPDPTDHAYTYQGLDIYIAKKDLMFLLDVTLDYEEQRDQQGFVFQAAN